MRSSNNRSGETRTNALWGSGSRDDSRGNALWGTRGGKRANALWGRGGRGAVITAVAALTLTIPLAAGAKDGGGDRHRTFISPGLVDKAKQRPGEKVHVIIQSDDGVSGADSKMRGFGAALRRRLGPIGALAVDIPAGKLELLSKIPGLIITPDAPVKVSGSWSKEMWPYESGNARLWGSSYTPAPNAPTIAIVDSGIDANRADFDNGSRVLPPVTMTTLPGNSAGDGRGHGTFVAGIAAGSAAGYAGAVPNAKILPIDVMDDKGMALTSDVIAACEYILQNKSKYNIKVANFSLHSSAKNHFYNDPLDRAVEKLWLNGIFVVAAAGNYGSANGPSGVMYAPGNDPFVMTVGAVDLGNSIRSGDDFTAPWSAYGYTEDGFSKPELGAPGRYMVGPVPSGASLAKERADHVVAPGYMELSGTSFAAPIVAGTAAQILALHPSWTPDQVKGALMVTAKSLPRAPKGSSGVGELNAGVAALYVKTPPNPNKALNAFLSSSGSGSALAFDSVKWNDAVKASASWADASWADASWADASWNAASWADASWAAASWADASWADASWAAASWADTSTEDAAEGDAGMPSTGMSPELSAELQMDPDLALPLAQVLADPSIADPAPPSQP